MPYYPEANILFIHIPKTGGTVIEQEISKQFEQTLYSQVPNDVLDFPYDSTSLQHQYYTTLHTFQDKVNVDFDNAKVFSVVRNPYTRIISDLFWLDLIKKNFTANQVYDVIKNNYLHRNDLDNHNQPQYLFVTDENNNPIPRIKIFKCERLNESNEILNNYLGINIDIRQTIEKKEYLKYLNKDSIALINDFYKLDFLLFQYCMLHVW
jgi:hypothetical protein